MTTTPRLAACWLLALAPCLAWAHDMPMAYVGVQQHADNAVTVTTKAKRRGGGLPHPLTLEFGADCTRAGKPSVDATGATVIRQWRMQCRQSLAGSELRVRGLSNLRPEAIVHLQLGDGREAYLRAERFDASIILGAAPNSAAVGSLTAYFAIGVEHILAGPDHLLFVLGLLLVLWRVRRGAADLVATITAFTVAHSITLALAVLGGITLPATAVEAAIALSILLLAVELATHERRQAAGQPLTLTFRRPWLVAFAFGLLHGFGFAGALADIGLPEHAQAWALLFFHLGVEAGQLLFVAGVALAWFASRYVVRTPRAAAWATTAVGAVASYWLIGRLSLLVGA